MLPAGIGADYKKQETYYASQEYKDGVEQALETGNKLPTLETRDRKITSRNRNKKLPPLSYPLATGSNQRTGDRLVIKCLKFEPPESGAGATVTPINMFKKEKDGTKVSAITSADKKLMSDDENVRGKGNKRMKVYNEKGELMNGTERPGIDFKVTDANSRLSKDANRLMKYLIELPIPQDITDSNSITWGEDRANALELGALAVAQKAMAGNPLEDGVAAAQAAVTALNTGIDIPGLKPETQGAVRAALSGAAIGALGSNISASSVIARSTGQILNSNLELLFQGMNLRSFPYSITFSPRSEKESTVVKAIIRSLKMSMAPKAGQFNGSAQGIFLQSPDLFQLEYRKNGLPHPFLNKMKLTALTGMNVNYTNAGTYASYDDGTPVNIRMDLTFKEINPIYHEDYLPGYGAGEGVGF